MTFPRAAVTGTCQFLCPKKSSPRDVRIIRRHCVNMTFLWQAVVGHNCRRVSDVSCQHFHAVVANLYLTNILLCMTTVQPAYAQ